MIKGNIRLIKAMNTKGIFMGTMNDKKDDPNFVDTKCSFCGDCSPNAHWNYEVFTCSQCAIEILPALIADALFDNDNLLIDQKGTSKLGNIWNEIEKVFWRASSLTLMRKARSAFENKYKTQKDSEGFTNIPSSVTVSNCES